MCGGGLYTEVLGLSCAGELGWYGFLWRRIFKRVSKIALGCIVWPSFKWLSLAASMWMWNLSSIFRWAPFLWWCSICIMSCMCPKEWASMSRCFVKLELWLWLLKALLQCKGNEISIPHVNQYAKSFKIM